MEFAPPTPTPSSNVNLSIRVVLADSDRVIIELSHPAGMTADPALALPRHPIGLPMLAYFSMVGLNYASPFRRSS
jgi:hypothetical protein